MGWTALAVVSGALATLALSAFAVYTALGRLERASEAAGRALDALMRQRHEELPKVLHSAKLYIGHEREVLRRLAEAGAAFERAHTVQESWRAHQQVHGALARLFAVAESYPPLKADASFRQLQDRVWGLEEDIAEVGARFNRAVRALNARLGGLTGRWAGRALGLSGPRALFAGQEHQPSGLPPARAGQGGLAPSV